MPADNFERPKPVDLGSNNYWGVPTGKFKEFLKPPVLGEDVQPSVSPNGVINSESMAGQRRLIVPGDLKPQMPSGS